MWCSACKTFLPVEQFWPDKNAGAYRTDLDGIRRTTRCKDCKNKEYIKIDPRRKLLYNARNRASANGWECTIEVEDIEIPELCPVLGIALEPVVGQGRQPAKSHPNSPTLDRVDPNKGYVKGNVAVISARANILKSNGTADEFRAILRYMDEHSHSL